MRGSACDSGGWNAYAWHVVKADGRFVHVERSAKDVNAHMPTVEFYQRMISASERRGRILRVDKQRFDALIEAQVHPFQRASLPQD